MLFLVWLISHQNAEENTAKVADLLSLLQSFQFPFERAVERHVAKALPAWEQRGAAGSSWFFKSCAPQRGLTCSHTEIRGRLHQLDVKSWVCVLLTSFCGWKKHIYSLYFVIKLTEFESWYFFLIKSNKAQNLLRLLDGRHATNNAWN